MDAKEIGVADRPRGPRRDVPSELDIVSGKVSKNGVILRPQPTNDPNEPLVRALEILYSSSQEAPFL